MHREFWYGSITLFTSILHNVFLLYHVETFVTIYKIDKASFWFGEIVFLIWNSINDPLFGWFSDRKLLDDDKVSNISIVMQRIRALRIYGPLFGLSFLSFWFSWTFPTLQFIFCLCLYDGFLTVVDLNHSALMADLAVSVKSRTNLNFYSSLFSVFGSCSVFLSYLVWHSDRHVFQMYCLVLSFVSIVGFVVGTKYLRHHCVLENEHKVDKKEASPASHHDGHSVKAYVKQVVKHKNFMWFSVLNLVQVFHCHFNSNFFPLFLENLLDGVSPEICSVLLGLSFVAPHLNNLYFTTLCQKYGVYAVITGLFTVKLVLSGCLMILGPDHMLLLAFFIASNRVFTEGTCKLLCLVISDLVDEDFALYQRRQPVSALMFGTANLLSKPGQTLAPLVGTWLLSVQTGHDIFQGGDSLKADLSHHSAKDRELYRQGCFNLLTYVPIVCAVIQLLAWSRYDLRGKKLRRVKSFRASGRSGDGDIVWSV